MRGRFATCCSKGIDRPRYSPVASHAGTDSYYSPCGNYSQCYQALHHHLSPLSVRVIISSCYATPLLAELICRSLRAAFAARPSPTQRGFRLFEVALLSFRVCCRLHGARTGLDSSSPSILQTTAIESLSTSIREACYIYLYI